MSILLSNYQIGVIGSIRANAERNQVSVSTDDNGNMIISYREFGKDMVAIIDDVTEQTHTMTRELYEENSEPVQKIIENIGVVAEEEPTSSETEVQNEDNEGA